MINLITSNEQDKIQVSDELMASINKVIEACEEEEKINFDNEISLIFTDNISIRQINKDYRDIDKETDVLSFPMYDIDELKAERTSQDKHIKPLGDIVVSLEKAKEQAEEYGHSFEREVCYLVCHSMFHLMGYDHMEEEEKEIMREKEKKVMKKLNISR